MITAKQLIADLQLQPLPGEGGYYRVTHTSDLMLSAASTGERYGGPRYLSGAIYYLVTPLQFSSMHRLKTDELYFYHCGDPLEMLFLYKEGRGKRMVLGMDPQQDQHPQILAPRDCWQGSRPLPGGTYGFTLVSTCMAPAYHEEDFLIGDRDHLVRDYPSFQELIRALTRTTPFNVENQI